MATITSGAAGRRESHWYTPTGEAMHSLPTARGNGDTRPTTIRDARNLGLLPSVTNVLGVLDKPTLTTWKLNKALAAADANPRKAGESLEYWAKRVNDISWEEVVDAADRGTKIHAALDGAFEGRPVPEDLVVYVQPVLDWIKDTGLRITHREHRIVCPQWGFAGTADVLFEYGKNGIGILDYKTKKTQPGVKVSCYLEHYCQAAAYAAGHYGPENLHRVLAANVFISSTEPGRIEVVKHTEVGKHFELFQHIAAVWRGVKGYDPRPQAGAVAVAG